ncbi:MAG: hypothetical protein M9938_08945 [Solirubrobacterales bacterium]|nr:hypothetical protein [Solirubrobacterales bacterium]
MKRVIGFAVAAMAILAVALPTAASAIGPPLPKEVHGRKVSLYATGVAIPTQYAFAGRKTFIAGAKEGKPPGGIFVRRPGSRVAKKVPGTGPNAFGVAFRHGRLYVSTGNRLIVYRNWNGRRFLHKRNIFKRPRKSFTSLNGIAIGPDGRLYAGLSFEFDHAASTRPLANGVISMKRSGRDVRVVSRGLRQPWMMTFVPGQRFPIVSDLAQDEPEGTLAPDLLVRARPNSDFGFPTCTWESGSPCDGFTKPLMVFPALDPSPSPMGLAARGRTVYVALFGGLGQGPEVVRTTPAGAEPKPVLTGFVAPVLSVASHHGFLYAGDLTGSIYRVRN